MKRYLKQLELTRRHCGDGRLVEPAAGTDASGSTTLLRVNMARELSNMARLLMKPALESTYGVIVYQEQVMQISKGKCGFTGGQADMLRKAIGCVEDSSVLAKLKNELLEGYRKPLALIVIQWRSVFHV